MREGGVNQLKISAPLPLRQTYWLIPVPLSAKSISLDSPFKDIFWSNFSAMFFVACRAIVPKVNAVRILKAQVLSKV
jgi:hypothetical protein